MDAQALREEGNDFFRKARCGVARYARYARRIALGSCRPPRCDARYAARRLQRGGGGGSAARAACACAARRRIGASIAQRSRTPLKVAAAVACPLAATAAGRLSARRRRVHQGAQGRQARGCARPGASCRLQARMHPCLRALLPLFAGCSLLRGGRSIQRADAAVLLRTTPQQPQRGAAEARQGAPSAGRRRCRHRAAA
jgi:hypothetical protein